MQLSIWERETFFAQQDVVIIGSGFVGLWSAYFLKKKHPKLKVTIVDRGMIPTGASSRNAGFACFGSLSEVVYDAKTMGSEKMLELVEMRFKGLERIQKYFSSKVIDFDLCGGYELYDEQDKEKADQLHDHITYINSLLKPVTGSKQTYELSDDLIGSFGFGRTHHLVKNKLEGYLHSGKLLQALLSTVQGMGVQVFNLTEIQAINTADDILYLKTNHQQEIEARKVLICTNAFTQSLVPELDIIPARGQVLLTSPIEHLEWKGTFHSDEGYYYFRNLGKRVLLGGARNKAFQDEQTTEMNTSDNIQMELQKYLDEVVLPNHRGQYFIEHRWAGIMAMGSEKLPIVKELRPNIYCAVRMSGMGVALAPVVARQVTKLITA